MLPPCTNFTSNPSHHYTRMLIRSIASLKDNKKKSKKIFFNVKQNYLPWSRK
ncbi:ABC transporter ATP-binding protein [Flavitalea sp.]